jgi:predicted  nucleic acid-binding Zn-ribbon protein
LNGVRDAEVQDLPEEAGLLLGSQAGSYILVSDQAVEARHATVYSVKGQFYVRPEGAAAKCFVNFRPVPDVGTAISDRDIVMFGRTLCKFWRAQAPVAGPAPAAPAAAAAPDPKVAKERDELKDKVAKLEQQLKDSTAGASAAAQSQLDAAMREKNDLKGQLEQSKKQSRTELDQAKEEADKRVADVTKERDDLKTAKEDLEKSSGQLSKDVEEAKKRATDAEAEAAKVKPDLEQKEKELEAARKALEAFQTAEAQSKRDRRSALRDGSDLKKAASALALPDALQGRLLAALRDEIDREVLTRSEGPVVPLRGLHCPGCDLDLEKELSPLKGHRMKVEALKALGIAGLSADDASALIAKARAK